MFPCDIRAKKGLPEISLQHGNEFIGGRRLILLGVIGVDHVVPDVPFDHLRHQSVYCATTGGDLLENGGTLLFTGDSFLKSLHLSANPPDSRQ